MRVLARGEEESCRQKAVGKVKDFIESLPENISQEEKMEKLCTFFNKVVDCNRKLAENFEPNEFFLRGHDEKTPAEQLSLMIKGHITSVLALQGIKDEMEKNPLAHVNGTSVKFAQCAQLVEEESIRLEQSKAVFINGSAPQDLPPTIEILMKKLACHVAQIISACLFIPDMLSTN